MASKFAKDRDVGYEEDRFESPVSENFKCSICLNVLKNPKSCGKNQHYFCFGCITPHLENHDTCPECMEELTPETLAEPPRLLLNCISELRLKCIYNQRGCPEYIQLGRLRNHIDQCGFAPAVCENEGCGVEVNRQDKVNHEAELCKFRKMECYGCGELKKEIEEVKRNQEKVNDNMDRKFAELMENQLRMKEGVKAVLKDSLDKVESIFSATQSVSQPKQDAQASKQQVLPSFRKLQPPINHDVIVMGGWIEDDERKSQLTCSVEKYSYKDGAWVDLAPMSVPRAFASAVVLENQIIVTGGCQDSIEILNLDQRPLKWVMSAVKLPRLLYRHQTFLYGGKLILVFRSSYTIEEVTVTIFEVPLDPAHPAKELNTVRITPAKKGVSGNDCYRQQAELVREKIFIFIGMDVFIYDLVKNESHRMPGLPTSMYNASTLLWRSQNILLVRRNDVIKDNGWCEEEIDAILYDTETGESEILPAMKHKRNGCSVVSTDDVIIVMGGHYNSAEFYDFRTNTWQAFRAMKEMRSHATAVVSPVLVSMR